ncbi:MAG: AbrB/MazE/SpoVT family DNA-binding domain-containing protein [Candidatus Aenigmarchaeota archaeon]|nr:AbrB/MazE/SpoVT family DNA-binding domain-containing protein [Candidatus Aenigmarchaeota archaeon]
MTNVKIDDRGRILIPQEIREAIHMESEEVLNLVLEDDTILLRRLRHKKTQKKDSLLVLLESPMHVDPKKLKGIDLEEIENKMWLP